MGDKRESGNSKIVRVAEGALNYLRSADKQTMENERGRKKERGIEKGGYNE